MEILLGELTSLRPKIIGNCIGNSIPSGPHELTDHFLKYKENSLQIKKTLCLGHLKALVLVEVVDLFKNFVYGSDDARLRPGEAVTVIFQPGEERSEGRSTVRTDQRLTQRRPEVWPGWRRRSSREARWPPCWMLSMTEDWRKAGDWVYLYRICVHSACPDVRHQPYDHTTQVNL